MDGDQDGIHEVSDNGDFVTCNSTSDPQYPDGSYYVSYGNPDAGHVTQVFSSDGEQIGGD